MWFAAPTDVTFLVGEKDPASTPLALDFCCRQTAMRQVVNNHQTQTKICTNTDQYSSKSSSSVLVVGAVNQ
jgi:hypothetical protein